MPTYVTMFSRDEALILATLGAAGFLAQDGIRKSLTATQVDRLTKAAAAGNALIVENPDHVKDNAAVEAFLSALEKITKMAHLSQVPDPL
jgi:hypothetical protein